MTATVYLTGAPASGKTTLGRRLAQARTADFVDLDEEIVRLAGRSVPEIFAEESEIGFRARESAALASLAAVEPDRPRVVALGGGTLLDGENRSLCEKTGAILCLETPSGEELARRLGATAGSRPLGDRARERAAHYASFPRRITASFDLGDSLVVVGENIAAPLLGDMPYVIDGNLSRILSGGSRSCATAAGQEPGPPGVMGGSRSCATAAGQEPGPPGVMGGSRSCATATGQEPGPPGVMGGSRSCATAFRAGPILTIPSGEEHKTLATVASIWSSFAAAGLGRRDRVAAVGGGVTGDLTGFAAATWMRGIDWINVPTTLLAMVDASTGGKTGCDLPEGKNLAGAFHSPKLVIIDVAFLKTLPPEILADGRAEMIKHEVIAGKSKSKVEVEEWMKDPSVLQSSISTPPTAREVAENLAVKIGIVREDPFETKGRRLLLNCGHTVAHAVEKLTDYRASHGSAVAIGCVEEARLAVRLGLAPDGWPAELAARFAAAGLPTALPEGIDFGRMRPVMRGDKKRAGDAVTFALPCGWGDVRAVSVDLKD